MPEVHSGYVENAQSLAILQDYNESLAHYHLLVQANEASENSEQMYFAGYAEGYATADLFQMYWKNLKVQLCGNYTARLPEGFTDYAAAQRSHIISMHEQNPHDYMITLTYQATEYFLQGMRDGIRRRRHEVSVSVEDLMVLNSLQDFESLNYFFNRSRFDAMESAGTFRRQTAGVHTSPELDDIWVFHNTWDDYYGSFLKIAKSYRLFLRLQFSYRQNITFTSIPGGLTSADPFIEVQTGTKTQNNSALSIVGCDLHNYNRTLLGRMDRTGNASFLTAFRMFAAVLSADTPAYFYRHFRGYSGRTRHLDLVVINYAAFQHYKYQNAKRSGGGIESDWFIWEYYEGFDTHSYRRIDEQLIGNRYYLLDNIPADAMVAKNLNFTFSKDESARHCIAHRDLAHVLAYPDFRYFARYNDYLSDPCSHGLASEAIAPRFDLLADEGQRVYYGAVDAKTASMSQATSGYFDYIVGQLSNTATGIDQFDYSTQQKAKPLGYFDRFPALWHETAAFVCIGDPTVCSNGGECAFGSCICPGYWKGIYCQACPDGFTGDCTECRSGFRLVGNSCIYTGSKVGVIVAFAAPLTLAVVGIAAWWFYYRKRREDGASLSMNDSELDLDDVGVYMKNGEK